MGVDIKVARRLPSEGPAATRVPMYFASDFILPRTSVGNRLSPEDLCSLTLLIFSHVNCYRTFKLNMEACIPLEADEASELLLKGYLEP
jgi:hypothetical protein